MLSKENKFHSFKYKKDANPSIHLKSNIEYGALPRLKPLHFKLVIEELFI